MTSAKCIARDWHEETPATRAQPIRPLRLVSGAEIEAAIARIDSPAEIDYEAVEEIFEPDYILDTHGTVILFRNKRF